MRLSAYKQSIDEAKTLPRNIPKLSSYFEHRYSPQLVTMHYILDMARKDSHLFNGEFVELYKYMYGPNPPKPD